MTDSNDKKNFNDFILGEVFNKQGHKVMGKIFTASENEKKGRGGATTV